MLALIGLAVSLFTILCLTVLALLLVSVVTLAVLAGMAAGTSREPSWEEIRRGRVRADAG